MFDKKNPFPLLANTQSFGSNSDSHKTTQVEGTLKINQIEVAAFTDTWLNDITKDQLSFEEYQKYHHIRQKCLRPSGGVSEFVINYVK